MASTSANTSANAIPWSPTPLELAPIEPEQATVLARLMQLYAHDFSDFMPLEIGDDGAFAAPDVARYFGAPIFHPFFIKMDGRLAGFVIVAEESRLGNLEAPLDLAELFVLRRYRGQGVGRAAAEAIFSRFRGKWEVRQVARNAPATAFWRRVIDRYTGGAFTEEIVDDHRWRGPVQRFDNRGAPPP